MANHQDAARRAFRRLLAKHEMTTKQVAREIGVVPATLYNWLRKPTPTDLGPATLTKIATLFGLTLEQMQRPSPDVIANSESQTPVFARVRTLRQIDQLLADMEDPRQQALAALVLVGTLRALRDDIGLKRAARPGARKVEIGRTRAVLALLGVHGDVWAEASQPGAAMSSERPPLQIAQCAREWC